MAGPIENPEIKAYVTGTDHGKADCNWWEYSFSVRNIARNSRITYPSGVELDAIKTFINTIVYWDGSAYAGTRPWLGIKLNLKAVSGTTFYVGDDAVEPSWVLIKVLEHISRDLKKIPVNDTEKDAVNAMLNVLKSRALGTQPYFGGVSGSYDNGGIN